jgi:ABC-type transport system involved in multi-copper enzyme maturation permease subunit
MEQQILNSKDITRGKIQIWKVLYASLLLLAAAIIASKYYVLNDPGPSGHPWSIGHPWAESTLFLMGLHSLSAGFEKRYKQLVALSIPLMVGGMITIVLWGATVLTPR